MGYVRHLVLRALPALLIIVTVLPSVSADGEELTPVQDLAVRPSSDGPLVSWQPPASNGGSAIDRYEVSRWDPTISADANGWSSPIEVAADITSFLDESASGSLYAGYRVTVFNTAGASAEMSVYILVRDDFGITPETCYVGQARTSPPGATVNGTCAITAGVSVLPSDLRDDVREPLIFLWNNILDQTKKLPSAGVILQ